MLSNSLKRQSVSSVVYDTLKRKIIELDYKPDQRLERGDVDKGIGMSRRTPLRQALIGWSWRV